MRVEVALGATFCLCRWPGLMLPGPRPRVRLGGKWAGGAGTVDETRSLNWGICSQRSPPSLDTDACGRESPNCRKKFFLFIWLTGSSLRHTGS